ncbi:hypothetical protein LOTGIDRAFT_104371 [Lottia gigantea]|uniref:RNA-binding region-containing protein 3 n=1 Tax=Lottia gigantea TaxID=225164 RepID=V4ARV6_LOTGI|nr:hypothetical protein LOTGIDRAFT_104371 [Lottia gigantea]ESO97585.1 hypothetical protein LOTGIDRAFT_104371 [Lottia gigantea]
MNLPAPFGQTTPTPPVAEEAKESSSESEIESDSGFGVIEPPPKPVETENTEEEADCSEFISEKELKHGCIPEHKRKDINVFKKYNKGDPSSRLYIKNLAKQATEKDLKYIYGRYIDWPNGTEANAFDIRVMKEGRMKGQAFVTLPSETAAIKALNDTHAFVLHDKPMVVQFARSAKATADPNTEDK